MRRLVLAIVCCIAARAAQPALGATDAPSDALTAVASAEAFGSAPVSPDDSGRWVALERMQVSATQSP